jgi:hypothetical protein
MHIPTRKLIGTFALLVLVTLWALAMAVAQVALTSTSGIVAGLYYVVAGLGWVLPAMSILGTASPPSRS